jgi:endonuclease/exonuclease/phosphatase (EEP) superfamily protein YafD
MSTDGHEPVPANDADADVADATTDRDGRRAVRVSSWVGVVVCWAVVAGLTWLTVSRVLHLRRPVSVAVLAQALTPWVFLPVYPVLALALWRRRLVLGLCAGVLVVVHVALLVPAIGTQPAPGWAADAPKVTVLSANLYDANDRPADVADLLVASGADVLVLVEVDREVQSALDGVGIESRFPYHVRNEFDGPGSVAEIYSRYPITAGSTLSIAGNPTPSATIDLAGDTTIEVLAVHVTSPTNNVDNWGRELDAINDLLAASTRPLVVAGDFNATRWNPQYTALLGQGVRDAVEARGRGLTFSWPVGRLLPFPVVRLDHALGNGSVAALANHDVRIPGSDHLGLLTTWAVRSEPTGG